MLRLRVVAHATLAERCDRGLCRLLHGAPPLERDERLDPRMATLAGSDRVAIRLALSTNPLVRPGDDARARLLLRQPVEVAAASFMRPSNPMTIGSGSPASRPMSKSNGSCPGVTLSAPVPNAGSMRASAMTGTRRSYTARRHHGRQPTRSARRPGGPPRRRRRESWPGARSRSRRPPGRHRPRRVADRQQRVVHLLVDDLEVGDRGLVKRTPVHDSVGAVDPAPIPEPDEERHHRADVVVVHREPLTRVVERAAQAAELAHDGTAGLLEPVPRPLDECLAPDVLAREALPRELPLTTFCVEIPAWSYPGCQSVS